VPLPLKGGGPGRRAGAAGRGGGPGRRRPKRSEDAVPARRPWADAFAVRLARGDGSGGGDRSAARTPPDPSPRARRPQQV